MKRFSAGSVEALFDDAGHLLHLGEALPQEAVPDYTPPIPHARFDLPSWPTAVPTEDDGWLGTPGIVGSGQAIASQDWQALADGVFEVSTTARGLEQLQFLCSVSLPLAHCTHVGFLRGAWTREAQWHKEPFTPAGFHQTTRTGRSTAEGYPGVYLYFPNKVVIVALAWSGDWEIHADWLPNGSKHLVLGEHLREPLRIDGTHTAPPAVVAVGATEDQARQRLHDAVRESWLPPHAPRGVHLNSWEAVYFDHNMDGLGRLIDAGKQAGAERFVLDDGWFGARRDDTRGLGDWQISAEVWPEGFTPLVKKLDEAGLEFGLWVEPEMVNPDSDLYRAHPEWVLGAHQVTGRGQLQLDLGQPAVVDYLFSCLDQLLTAYPIRYFKWDHNRLAQGAATRDSVLGLYDLFERLHAQHPALEIESCASGGGRVDYGVLKHCYRVWGSDNNDPIDRARIHAGLFRFLPPEVVGSHAGPGRAHTTSRVTDLATRVIVALQGSYGYEYDVAQHPDDIPLLKKGADWWRANRDWLVGSRLYLNDESPRRVQLKVAADGSRFALWLVQCDSAPDALAEPVHIPVQGVFEVQTVLDAKSSEWARVRANPVSFETPQTLSGEWLAQVGLPVPSLLVGQAVLIEGRRV